jgi:TniQ
MLKPDLSAVRPLPLRVSHRPHETAYSLLCRLAERNGSKSVRHLLQRVPNIGGSISHLSRELEVSLAALLSGNNPDVISESTPMIRGRSGRIGSYQGPADSTKFKICPLCFVEDAESGQFSDRSAQPYVRCFWHFADVIHCPTHRIELASKCRECRSRFSRATLFGYICTCGADVRVNWRKGGQRSAMAKSWNVLRQMGRLPDVPYWNLGRERYPARVKWAKADFGKTEYSMRELMIMGPNLLRPNFNKRKTVWVADKHELLEHAAKIYRENPAAWAKHTIASCEPFEDD